MRERLLAFTEEGFIIVEGTRDKTALLRIGLPEERILTLRTALYAVVEELLRLTRDVLILTDHDTRGEKLAKTLRHDLIRHGIRVHTRLREAFFATLRITHIEDLTEDHFAERENH